MDDICCICGNKLKSIKKENGMNKLECYNCGEYYIEIDDYKLEESQKDMMLYYINQNTSTCAFCSEKKDYHKNIKYITFTELSNLYPKDLLRRIEMIILNIASKSKEFGQTFHVGKDGHYGKNLNRILLMKNRYTDRSCLEVIEQLKEIGYITESTKSGCTDGSTVRLTSKGWLKAEDLRKKSEVIPQAFVAMWFDEKMKKARQNIECAIETCGYKPMIIDIKEHNNQIVPEIFYEIKRSKFVVADLTGDRGGVYYEAGYAEALGKEVIITCNNSSIQSVHFDVAQKNSIYWKDEEDLYKRLIHRIEATVGKINN